MQRQGRESESWPVALLLLAVVVPAGCLLWFMSAAMRNERFVVRQQMVDFYRAQLSVSQTQLKLHWKNMVAELETTAAALPPAAAFAACVRSGMIESVVVLDEHGRVAYPNAPSPLRSDFGPTEAQWERAAYLERTRHFVDAARHYGAVAGAATAPDAQARAVQAQARCLLLSGQTNAAIQLVEATFASARYQHAVDMQGRLIAANAELMALELSADRKALVPRALAARLEARLNDYSNPVLASAQRRFLMKQLKHVSPLPLEFPTLAAEELASELAAYAGGKRGLALQPGPGSQRWLFSTPNGRVLAAVRHNQLLTALNGVLTQPASTADIQVALVAPEDDLADALLTLAAGEEMPGWRLALSVKDRARLDSAGERRTDIYLWTGVLVIGVMAGLALLAVRVVRRQVMRARLKNELAATVSHELKTPLASIRVLVETLLESNKVGDSTAREYLQLIAGENERLTRLVQNFLTFARIERDKGPFHLVLVSPQQVVEGAIKAMKDRLGMPGCYFALEASGSLPEIHADAEALTTALVNLLDNAWKYSEEIKHIHLRVGAEDGRVLFSVRDNGTGIPRRELDKIFRRFYRVDHDLSRKAGGCGLGLSIVRQIVEAHGGGMSVDSEPGRGSTFTITLPAALADNAAGKATA